jgi:hypothetical protein
MSHLAPAASKEQQRGAQYQRFVTATRYVVLYACLDADHDTSRDIMNTMRKYLDAEERRQRAIPFYSSKPLCTHWNYNPLLTPILYAIETRRMAPLYELLECHHVIFARKLQRWCRRNYTRKMSVRIDKTTGLIPDLVALVVSFLEASSCLTRQ